MTLEIIIVLVILVAAVVLFVTEKLPVDLIALLVMAALLLSRIISPEEGISGFSSTATVTVGAMFVLSAGLFKKGRGQLCRRGTGKDCQTQPLAGDRNLHGDDRGRISLH